MFFDKSDRNLDNSPSRKLQSIPADSTSYEDSLKALPGPSWKVPSCKGRLGRADDTAVGPGYYYHDSSFVKPTFNRLAVADGKKTRKLEEEKTNITPLRLLGEGGKALGCRSTLSERKALTVDLVSLVRDSENLSHSISQFEKIVEEQKTEQAELAKATRCKKPSKK